jgi:hypothetical protein
VLGRDVSQSTEAVMFEFEKEIWVIERVSDQDRRSGVEMWKSHLNSVYTVGTTVTGVSDNRP